MGTPDQLVWHFDKKGICSVRSCYKAAMELKNDARSSDQELMVRWWKSLWSLKVPSKVKLFVWRTFHDSIPTLFNLGRRGVKVNKFCPQCKESIETPFHALFGC